MEMKHTGHASSSCSSYSSLVLLQLSAHHLFGRFCTTGLPSDITVEVGNMTFHLHKVIDTIQVSAKSCLYRSGKQITAVSLNSSVSVPSDVEKQKAPPADS